MRRGSLGRETEKVHHQAISSSIKRGFLFASLAIAIPVGTPAYALVINPTFDSSITSDPNAAAIEGTINTAITTYETDFTDPITVAITFKEMSSGLGESSTFFFNVPYATYYGALVADAKTANDATALAHLAAGPNNPVTGTSTINATTPNLRAVGINANPPAGQPDGTIGLNTSLTFPGSPGSSLQFSLLVETEHQIDEVLGLGSGIISGFGPFTEDLFRYNLTGTRSFTSTSTATAFFSLDGTTLLAQFDNQNDGGDFGDWQSNPLPTGVKPQVQDAFATPGATPSLGVELTALDVIGYDLAQQIIPVPEPTSLALLGTALGGLGFLRRRKKAA